MPGVITQVSIPGLTQGHTLSLPAGMGVASLVVDTTTGFGYAGTTDSPGQVIKFRLSDMSLVSTLALNNGENNLTSAVIDPANHFAYFGTDTSPGQVVRIALAGFFEQGPTLTLAAGENGLTAGVLDYGNQYAYFGTGTNPALVIKTDLIGGLPTITQQPKNQSIVAGGNISFSIAATGRNLTYQWQKSGVAIPRATAPLLHVWTGPDRRQRRRLFMRRQQLVGLFVLDVPVLDEKGLHAGRLHPDAEASQLAVPGEHVLIGVRLKGVHRPFHDLGHDPLLLYCSVPVLRSASPDFRAEAGEAGGKHQSESRWIDGG